ncbi:MAG: hypothetical protein K0S04_2586 [Herbinix sp.]|jgi:uncharacterized membrane protein YeiB|nr:hypothetical protein [Herbinix sp.]
MQLINRKNFIEIVCICFTLISLGKVIIEKIEGYKDPYYAENFITIFLICLIATFVLSLQYYLQNVPITIVILGQYIILVGIIMFVLWIVGHFQTLASTAYRDLFFSFTIPYLIGAIIYYVTIFFQTRRANKILDEIKKEGEKRDDHEKGRS